MNIRLFTLLVFLASHSWSQLNCVWTAQKKISLNNYGYCVSTGPEGNVYVSGAFSGPYRNPGPQDMGCFLICYNSQGLEIWHKEFYSSIGAIAAFNKVDSKGNIILAGPGILKYNSQGILLDSFPAAGLRRCEALAIDFNDNIIIAGHCYGDSVIGNIRVIGNSFIAKYSSTGSQAWAISCYIDFGPNQDFDLTIDHLGNIYTTGGFGGTIQVSDNIKISALGHYDGFIIKYSPDSQPLWAKRFGGEHHNDSEYPKAAAVNRSGEVYITGTYRGFMTAENLSLPEEQGVSDIFVIKYDTDGNLQWLKSGGGADQDKVWEMTIDEHDNVFICGAYDSPGTFLWEGSPIAAKENDKGGLFVLQLETDGSPVTWLNAQGGHFKDIVCDNKGNLFATGACGSRIELAGKTLESEGGMLVAKLSYDMNNKVGIQEETTEENLFQIFPNPGKGFFNLSLSDDLCPDAAISVFEISGRCILIKEHIACEERHFECIAPPGIYLVELRSGTKRQTKKVVIQ